MKKRRIYYGINSKRIVVIRIMILLLLFLTIGYSLLNQSLLMNTNIEVAKLKVRVDAGQYLEHGTKRGTDCPAGSFCSGSTFSYNAEEDQGIISCALGSFSNAKSGTCTACQGKTTTDVGQSSCNSECSNKDGVDTWKNAVWNDNNSLTDLCTIQSCKEGYTKEGNTCGANTYHVTLDNQDATTVGTTSVDVVYNSDIPTITPPTKRGYTFKGYNYIIEHEEPTPDEEILYIKADGTSNKKWDLTSDKTLVAKWEVITATCKAGEYLPHDATSCSSCPEGSSCSGGDYPYHATEDQGSTLCPAGTYSTGGASTCSVCSGGASSEAGATSCNKSCSNAAHVKTWVNGCTISTCDTGYENKNNSCVARKFNIILDNKSATTPGSTSVEVTFNAPVPSITVPTKTGYTFGGYYSEDNGGGTQYIKNDGSSAKDWDKTNLTKLFAKWTIVSKTCSAGQYLPKGATSCSNCLAGSYCAGGTYSYKAGEDQGINQCAIGSYSAASASSCTACTGLTTSGVGKTSCDADCSNKANVSDWNPANWNNNNPTGLCSIKTCTVGYTLSSNACNASKYTITLDNKGATTPGSESVEVTYNAAVPNITVPAKTGYTFGGYYTEEDGHGTQYITADGKSAKNWNIPNETVLFAKWTAKSVTVSAGQYLPKNSLTPTDCPAGSYCVGGTFNFNSTTDQGIVSCAVGSYSASKKTACTVCSNGKTTSGTGKSSCDIDCSNKTGVSEWNTSSWNNNTPTGICSIKSCSTGYTLSSNKCNTNALVFDNQTISKDYNTSSQTANVTPATNGTGTYTYTKKSGDADVTVSSAGVITIPAGKAAGSYSVVITAKDSNSNVSKDATYTITINKVAATLTCSNKTYNGSEQTACSCTGGTVGGDYKATYYSATAYSASCTPDSNHTAPENKSWTMAKKSITITAKAQTVNYGTDISKTTSDVTVATLGTGDSLTAITLTPSTTDYTTNGTITPSAATIKKSSTDVTANYNITYNTGVLKINKVAATLTCSNKTYNGSEQTACSCSGGTVGGDYKATNYSATAYTASCTPDANHTAPENTTWTMAKKAITITAKAQTVNYGTAISKTTSDVTVATLATGDSLSAITLTESTTDYTTEGTITPSAATIMKSSTNVTSNYNITYKTGVLKINKVAATLTCSNKTYNGKEQTACSCTGGTVGGDYKATYAADSYTASCTPDGNHTAPANKTWKMNKKSITITAKDQTINYGASISKTTSDVTVATLGTGDSLSAITLTPSTTDYTTEGTITPSAATIKKSSTDVTANYTITYKTGALTVNKVAATLTCSNKTYNGSEQTACSCTGGTVGGDYKATYAADSYTASCTPDGNHTAPANKTWKMSKKAITITAKDQTVNFGTAISKTTSDVTVATLATGDSLSAITLTESTTDYTTSGTITPSDATIKKSSTDVTANYTITYKTGVLKVNKVAATLTCSNKTYNGSEQTACSCTGGTVGGDYKATYAADSYTASCTPDSNHTAPANKTWKMNKKSITITAKDQTVDFGTAISKTTSDVTVATLGTGDSLSAITLTPSTTDYTTNGTITPSVATIKKSSTDVTSNYTITYKTGVLKINKVAATLTCSNKTYNGSEQTACSCTGGTVGGDYKATYYSATAYSASCTPDSNHTAPANKTWTMAKKAITITAKDQTVNYGTSISTTTSDVTVATLGSGDSLSAVTLTPSTADYTTNGTITPSGATIKKSSTDVTSNYTITYKPGVLKINKVAAVLTCSNKTYNGTEQTACTCTGGTVGGDYKATNASDTAYTATCTGDGNHTNPSNKTWTMAKKAVTVTAASQSRAWNNSALTNNTCTAGSGQLVSGHAVTCTMTTASTITTAGSVDNEIDNVTIKSGSTDVTGNYNITKAKGTLTITEATPTVTLTAKTATYTGSAIAANTATVSPNSNPTITYTYYTNSDCSTQTGTTAATGAAAGAGKAPKQVGQWYVKASAAAVTNKTKAASSGCVSHKINQKKATITLTDSTKALTFGTAGTNAYTYDGDGTVSCTSSDTSKVTCSVDKTNKKIAVIPVAVTSSAVTITVKAGAGTNYSAPDNKTFTVTVADGVAPTVTNIGGGTSLKATSQNLTLKCSDDVGVTAYYFGTTNPTAASAVTTTTAADLTSLTGSSGLTKNVTQEGTYYLACKDAAGNYAKKSIVIRKYQVQNVLETIAATSYTTYTNANYATNGSAATYYVKDGTSMTIASVNTKPTGGNSLSGYTMTEPSTIAQTLSTTAPMVVNNNTTVYYMWWTRLSYMVTVNSGANGIVKVETVTQGRNSITVSESGSYSLLVKHGDTVKATATPSTGYSVTWSGGYVSGTTNPVTGAAVTAAKTITGTFADSTKPTCTITSTNTQKATSQTATLKCSDGVGVTSYYYGTSSSPADTDYVTTAADLTSLTGSSGLTKTINAAGTYYIFAKDAAGNISDAKSVVMRSYSVRNLLLNIAGTAGTYSTANYTQASSKTYYAPNNTSLAIASIYTIPTGAAAGTVKGYNLAAASTTAATLTAASTNVTLNGNKTISIWFDRNTYKVTITKPTNGTIKAETVTQTGNSVTASTAAAELTVRYGDKVKATATPSSGCSFTSWSGGYVSGTTSPATGAAVTAAKTITGTFEISSYNITYNANGGTFGSTTTNTVKYNVTTTGTVTKYSHTSNVDDTGLKSSDYGNSWTNANITGTDRGDISKAHVVTIPGASSINVDIYYNGESTSYDWVSVWEGSHPEYTAASNYSSGVSGGTKLGGSQSGSYTVNGNSLTNMGKSTFTIDGDTVTFGFKSDGSGAGQGYGYYAIVTGVGKTFTVNTGTYSEPTQTNKIFTGWNTKADGSGTSISNDSELSKLTSVTATLYAQYRDSTATFTTGQEFNAAIKQLAGTASATYSTSDSNITKFQKYTATVNQTLLNNATVVSSADSESIIYAWFSSGTIYWYTTSSTIYFNSNSSYMFNNITNLATLDLSNFDFSKVSSSSSMFNNTTALNTIVTPKVNSSSSVSLGKTFVDQSNTTYSSLTSSTPTETTLKVPYTITFDLNGGMNSTCSATANTKQIYPGNKLGTIPEITATKFGYAQGGWCSDSECNNVVNLTENTIPTSSTTYYIQWTKEGVWADNVSYSHSGISCSDTQCVLDYLANQYKEKRRSTNGS